MKHIILLFGIAFAFVSCNTEIPEDQFRTQFGTQCMKSLAKKMVGEDATEEQKTEFCDCYTDVIIADNEVITMKTMINAMKNQEEFAASIEACENKALVEDKMEEEVVPVVDSTEVELEEQ